MAKEKPFSAAYYSELPADKFTVEAKRLDVDLYGKSRDQQINAVYNAERRRRGEEQAAKEAAEAESEETTTPEKSAPAENDYTVLTRSELMDLADERSIDVDSRATKADIIAALEADDAGAKG